MSLVAGHRPRRPLVLRRSGIGHICAGYWPTGARLTGHPAARHMNLGTGLLTGAQLTGLRSIGSNSIRSNSIGHCGTG
ncbi:MAG TPA: hypothetical protein DHU96_22285, partial [Actinobacteria bacterium]|nr:hypothetical protein [Actinomycetota bacterium]